MANDISAWNLDPMFKKWSRDALYKNDPPWRSACSVLRCTGFPRNRRFRTEEVRTHASECWRRRQNISAPPAKWMTYFDITVQNHVSWSVKSIFMFGDYKTVWLFSRKKQVQAVAITTITGHLEHNSFRRFQEFYFHTMCIRSRFYFFLRKTPLLCWRRVIE